VHLRGVAEQLLNQRSCVAVIIDNQNLGQHA
jgi:hypothetical protein